MKGQTSAFNVSTPDGRHQCPKCSKECVPSRLGLKTNRLAGWCRRCVTRAAGVGQREDIEDTPQSTTMRAKRVLRNAAWKTGAG